MTRKAIGIAALILALVLVAAGGLTLAGSRYIDGNVHDQLASQKISFAPAGSPGLPADIQLDLIYSGEGTFWTDLKGFGEASAR